MPDVLPHRLPLSQGEAEAARWLVLRRAERECDHGLTGTARLWLRRLPVRRRPLRLCEAYPRVANRLAWCWSDVALSEQLLDDLLQDRRGGRRGFPQAMVRELLRLREFNGQQRVELGPEPLRQRLARLLGLA